MPPPRQALPLVLLATLACAGPAREVVPASPAGRAETSPPAPDAGAGTAIDALHYRLELRLDPDMGGVLGSVAIECVAREEVREVALDARGLAVLAARDGAGRALEHRAAGDVVALALREPLSPGEACTVSLDFAGSAEALETGAAGTPGARVARLGRAGGGGWFPRLAASSDRATVEWVVDLPEGWSAFAAGERVDVRVEDGRRVERWRSASPATPGSLRLVAGELAAEAHDGGAVSVTAYRPRGAAGDAAGELAIVADALRFCEELTGLACPDRPFASFEAGRGGASPDPAERDVALAAEAAAAWFGGSLAPASDADAWLIDAAVAYAALLFVEHREGEAAFQRATLRAREAYLAGGGAGRAPIASAGANATGDGTAGALRLHLLRQVLGRDGFERGLRRFAGLGQHRAVSTADLRAALEAATSVDLARFFAEWIDAPGVPELEVAWRHDAERGRVLLRVDQVHPVEGGVPGAFAGPALVAVAASDGTREHRVEVTDRRHVFELPCASAPESVTFDSARWWPARIRREDGGGALGASAGR